MSTSTEPLPLGLVDEHMSRLEGALIVRRRLMQTGAPGVHVAALDRRIQAHMDGLRVQSAEAVRKAMTRLHSTVGLEACAAAITLLDLEPGVLRCNGGAPRLRPVVAGQLAEVFLPPGSPDSAHTALQTFLHRDRSPGAEKLAAAANPLARTSLAVVVPTGPATPFVPGEPMPLRDPAPSPSLHERTPRSPITGTLSTSGVPAVQPLPFAASDPTRQVEARHTRGRDLPREPSRPGGLAETSLALDMPKAIVLPFATSDEGSPVGRQSESAPVRAPLTGTAMALDLPTGVALPFTGAPPMPPSAHPGGVAATTPWGPVRSDLTGTAASTTPLNSPSLPFASLGRAATRPAGEQTSAPSAAKEARALPFANDAPAGRSRPRLSLLEHAWLCAEIVAAPMQAREILVRYGVSESTKPAVDKHYIAEMEKSEKVRSDWSEAFWFCFRSLTATSGGPESV